MSNLIGNPFRSFVTKQINSRQKVLSGSGSLGGRDERFLKYVSKTPWLRMASSIDITDREKAAQLGLQPGSEASQQFVLQGGTIGISRVGPDDNPTYTSLGQKFGVSTDSSIINTDSYGFGGSKYGKTPMPGLTSIVVSDMNKGAIRKAKVDFTCTNLQQFEIINTLYMRPGYDVLIEWGHSVYLNDEEPSQLEQRLDFNTPAFTSFFEGKSVNTLLNDIQTEIKNSYGNYDAFIGRVTNFTWKFINGVYECSIIVFTQGDVIEALKVNGSFNPTLNIIQQNTLNVATGVTDAATPPNTSAVQDATVVVIEDKNPEENKGGIEPIQPAFIANRDNNRISNILYNNYVELTKNQTDNSNTIKDSEGFTNFLKFSNGNQNKWFFVSLGALLRIIEDNTLLYDKSTKTPIINIDSSYTTNFCARFPEQVSTDWNKCYLPYKVYNSERTKYVDNPEIDKILGTKEKRYDKQNYVGQLMCILLNCDYVNSLLMDNADDKGRISLKDFLSSLLKGIQQSIGGINKFEVGYDYITNSLRIYDNSPFASSQLAKQEKPKISKFQSYGVQKNQSSSFLLDLNIESTLSQDFVNAIAIGSQVNGNQIGENATSFSLWNKGLINRVRKTNLDIQNLETETLITTTLLPEQKLKQNFLNNKQKLYNLLRNINSTPSSTEDLKSAQNINTDFSNYYLGLATEKTENLNLPGNTFIPFDLGLKMDGLSGMRIYDAFSITNEVLPSFYTDALQLFISGINHSITDAGWTTSLNSLAYNKFEATNPNPIPLDPDAIRGEADEIEIVEEVEDPTPNADFLMVKMRELGVTQKLSGDNGAGDPNFPGPQLSNGGDITKEMAFATIIIFQDINTKYPIKRFPIQITGGNDLYHQNNPGSANSNHRIGKAIDFTIKATKVVQRNIFINNILTYVKGDPLFNTIDEYKIETEYSTGGHYHIEYGGSGKGTTAIARTRANKINASFTKTFDFGTPPGQKLVGTRGGNMSVGVPGTGLEKQYDDFINGEYYKNLQETTKVLKANKQTLKAAAASNPELAAAVAKAQLNQKNQSLDSSGTISSN
tara:strand:- start:791 stop:3970 length:3180 start_codon:yes stop_codon:yes gene_type:complete